LDALSKALDALSKTLRGRFRRMRYRTSRRLIHDPTAVRQHIHCPVAQSGRNANPSTA
jgi:hypothetical protein